MQNTRHLYALTRYVIKVHSPGHSICDAKTINLNFQCFYNFQFEWSIFESQKSVLGIFVSECNCRFFWIFNKSCQLEKTVWKFWEYRKKIRGKSNFSIALKWVLELLCWKDLPKTHSDLSLTDFLYFASLFSRNLMNSSFGSIFSLTFL